MFSPPTTPPKFSLPTQVHVLSLSRSLKQNTENQNKERNSKTKDAKQNKTKQKAYKTNKQTRSSFFAGHWGLPWSVVDISSHVPLEKTGKLLDFKT